MNVAAIAATTAMTESSVVFHADRAGAIERGNGSRHVDPDWARNFVAWQLRAIDNAGRHSAWWTVHQCADFWGVALHTASMRLMRRPSIRRVRVRAPFEHPHNLYHPDDVRAWRPHG